MERLEKLLFYGIVLFLPTQLGKHFWPPFAFVEGLRVDYLSPTVYLTDILILLLFLTWLFTKFQISNYLPLVVLVCIGSIGMYFSVSPIAGFYKLAKLIEFIFLGFYIASTASNRARITHIATLLAMGVVFESFLAIMQFANQSSLGGLFWFFGERMFSGQTPGIANAVLDGELVLRPYGTFSHPNVLAGYLTIAMAMVISNIKFQISNFKWGVVIVIGTIALFLTLSRVAILLWVLLLAMNALKMFKGNWKLEIGNWKFVVLVVLVLIGSIGVISLTPLPSRFISLATVDRESFVRRQELNNAAIEMFKESPIFGIGLNNFLIRLPEHQKATAGPLWLQPVHNIYLLILAETGIVGFVFFLWFVGKTFVRIKDQSFIIHHSPLIILLIVLILGFFDHYFLTLQQGQLLLSVVFGFVWTKQ